MKFLGSNGDFQGKMTHLLRWEGVVWIDATGCRRRHSCQRKEKPWWTHNDLSMAASMVLNKPSMAENQL